MVEVPLTEDQQEAIEEVMQNEPDLSRYDISMLVGYLRDKGEEAQAD